MEPHRTYPKKGLERNYSGLSSIPLAAQSSLFVWLTSTNNKGKWVPKRASNHLKFLSFEKGFFKLSLVEYI